MSTLHMLASANNTICESFILETEEGLVVIDGGFPAEAESLLSYIRSLGGEVSAWFLTHPHDDHYGAFCQIMRGHPGEIRVKGLYYNFLPEELLNAHDPVFSKETSLYLPMLREIASENGIPVITPRKGDVYSFGSAVFRVLREPDPSITNNCINNSSVVLRLEVQGKRVLFLGDLGVEGGEQLFADVGSEALRSDYVQMAHHGQGGVGKNVYEAIAPKCCLWCTPAWLWDNIGPEGEYDSGVYKTIIVRGWMSELGVKKHYVNMNGTFKIEL